MTAKINVYLNFAGYCEKAFNYYRSIFGGEFEYLGRFADMPTQDGVTLSEEMKNKIMHISLRINEETVLMGSDTGGEWAPELVNGNNFSLSITAESKDEADTLFGKLTDGGNVTMPLASTFWGDYFGMGTDKFGVNWMVSFNEQQS